MSLRIYTNNPELRQLLVSQVKKWRETDSGFDIPMLDGYVTQGYGIPINLGIRVSCQSALGFGQPILLLPRSSLSSSPLRLANSIGLIDMGYRGDLLAKVDSHVGHTWSAGTRYFQLCRGTFQPWGEVVIVDTLDDLHPAPDDRGEGGFGSTGK